MVDRLADLPDDLLRRVLHFAPAKEAASTSALSRRWRSLWRSSGALNLEARAHCDDRFLYVGSFVSAAKAALNSADEPVARLTIHATGDAYPFCRFLGGGFHSSEDHIGLVARVLCHPALRRVEELSVTAVDSLCRQDDAGSAQRIFALSLASLPSETLRVLDLTNCSGLTPPPPPGVAFPRLVSLRLLLCAVPLDQLQRVIDAAPALAAVRLEAVDLVPATGIEDWDDDDEEEEGAGPPLRLRCPSATTLTLENCRWPRPDRELEFDAPRLRRFRYKGTLRRFSLSPQPRPCLARADLHLISERPFSYHDPFQEARDREVFWRSVQSLGNVKQLKLKVKWLEDIAVVGAAERAKLLCRFGGLEHLELEGAHRPKGKTAAAAIANLLRCCPAVRELRIRLTVERRDYFPGISECPRSSLLSELRDDFNKSLDRFQHHRSQPAVSIEREHDNDVNCDEVSDLPALSGGRQFSCLQSSLRCVGLRSRMENSDCFGAKLIKFFAQNAVLLEEMRIDDGNAKMHEHMIHKVEMWIASSSQRARSDSPGGTRSFRILPLERFAGPRERPPSNMVWTIFMQSN
ncbi:F-box protein At3g03040 [Brachypodium distachyon]|uniref:F-box domain-containing protein n=1 Tax=Brachypodium distachyon TaxID=15368 RepID=A0A0Q3PE51_BRADI|nr:F-box protein At3g03040 [Brachypodium distachyon]KQJ87545.1 hypothetical protein BRADI_4g11810v3 [Brachypodium distachyon]|eukprot:XP_010239038.1 F-box protein At3g03040 [Brachypodium distachyon]